MESPTPRTPTRTQGFRAFGLYTGVWGFRGLGVEGFRGLGVEGFRGLGF